MFSLRKKPYALVSVLATVAIALALACSFPQDAIAKAEPWGAGTHFNVKTNTLTVKSGKHAIKSLSKTTKSGKYYTIDHLVIKGGVTKLSTEYGYLKSLRVSKGRFVSSSSLSVSGNMKVSGGTVSVLSSKRYGDAISVMEDLTVTGGKVVAKTTKEGCGGIRVSGDMRLKKGSVTIATGGKSASGLEVSGFLKVQSGSLKSTVRGKYATAVQVFGDLIMSKGVLSASSGRGEAIRCYDLLKVIGGKVSAKSAGGRMAIYSGDPAILKAACLGTIKGCLPEGAQFSKAGVTYQVANSYGPDVITVKGRTSSDSVSFGGVRYEVQTKRSSGISV